MKFTTVNLGFKRPVNPRSRRVHILPPKPPPASPSAPLREHLKDTQLQLKARIEELEKVRKQSAHAQKAAEDMLREERVKWEEERREKDSEIRDLRVKLRGQARKA